MVGYQRVRCRRASDDGITAPRRCSELHRCFTRSQGQIISAHPTRDNNRQTMSSRIVRLWSFVDDVVAVLVVVAFAVVIGFFKGVWLFLLFIC